MHFRLNAILFRIYFRCGGLSWRGTEKLTLSTQMEIFGMQKKKREKEGEREYC